MILKGSQRGGGRQMALHLLKTDSNEHVEVHQIRGFVASDVLGALNEAYALSKATSCKQYMYSLSLNPPQGESVPVSVFEETLERIEKRLGLEGQPRVVVFHEKEGRRHAHCVWSRIDIDEMKAVNMSHDRRKLNDIAKALYLEHGWKMPDGFKNKKLKNPLTYDRAEWQHAARTGRKADDIKRELQECWQASDSKKGFQNALRENGYVLAKGDRRGYVVMDTFGEVFSLPRQLGLKAKDLEGRLGNPGNLPSLEQAKASIDEIRTPLFDKYRAQLSAHHEKQMKVLLAKARTMAKEHSSVRAQLDSLQEKRWQKEENARSSKVRHGFKGLWDKLSGRYWSTRKENEREAWNCYQRDRTQRDGLIADQLAERQELQKEIERLREQQEGESKSLLRDLSAMRSPSADKSSIQKPAKSPRVSKDHDTPAQESDIEPDL